MNSSTNIKTQHGPFQYFAFISYSRRDVKLAEWLQRKLEWYRIPTDINPPPILAVGKRWIRPVFRDRTDLSFRDESFWNEINEKLNQSRYLIVICSPHTAKSPHVDQEIRFFLKTRADAAQHVLPVVIAGQPESLEPGKACLPPALRELGTYRERNLPSLIGSSREEFFLQIVSFLLAVDYSVINDRFQRRKRRQLTRLVIAGLLSALVFAAISAVAVYQWRIADQQRQIAVERTVNLRHILSGLLWRMHESIDSLPGALNLKGELLDGTKHYLTELSAAEKDDKGLEREVAVTYARIGVLRIKQGKLTDARAALERGLPIARRLAESDRTNAVYQVDLAASHNILATVCLLQGKLAEAERQFSQGLDLLTPLNRALPNYGPVHRELARVFQRLGVLYWDRGDVQSALVNLNESKRLYESLVEANPDSAPPLSELAETWYHLARMHRFNHKLHDALISAQNCKGLSGRIVETTPDYAPARQVLALGKLEMAEAHLAQGEVKASHQEVSIGLALLYALYAADPKNAEVQLDLALVLITQARVLGKDNVDAGESLLKASKHCEWLLQIDASNVAARTAQALTYGELALMRARGGLNSTAQADKSKFFELLRTMRAEGLTLSIQLLRLQQAVEGTRAK